MKTIFFILGAMTGGVISFLCFYYFNIGDITLQKLAPIITPIPAFIIGSFTIISSIYIAKDKATIDQLGKLMPFSDLMIDKNNIFFNKLTEYKKNKESEQAKLDLNTAFDKLINGIQYICELKLTNKLNKVAFEKYKPIVKGVYDELQNYYTVVGLKYEEEYYINIKKVYDKYCKKKQGIFCKFIS
jgi:hypothetical protein